MSKQKYSQPDFEVIQIRFSRSLLTVSGQNTSDVGISEYSYSQEDFE